MAQLVVRDLDEDVKARLKRRAERHGRSTEENRQILRNAVKEETDRSVSPYPHLPPGTQQAVGGTSPSTHARNLVRDDACFNAIALHALAGAA